MTNDELIENHSQPPAANDASQAFTAQAMAAVHAQMRAAAIARRETVATRLLAALLSRADPKVTRQSDGSIQIAPDPKASAAVALVYADALIVELERMP